MKKVETGEMLLMFQVFETDKLMANRCNKFFSKNGFGLHVDQMPVLMMPYYAGIITQQDIADQLCRDKSSVLRSVTSLIQSGLIVVAPDPFDKRRKLIQLTNEGKKIAVKIAEELAKVNDMIFRHFSEEEKQTLHDLLVKIQLTLEEL